MMKLLTRLLTGLSWRYRFIRATSHRFYSDIARGVRIYLAENGCGLTKDERMIGALKNRHEGQRCFVIGNGPSLKVEDLELLKNEITFAANKIYLAYDSTSWRPTYYFVSDVLVAQNNKQQIESLNDVLKIFAEPLAEVFEKDLSNCCYFPLGASFSEKRSVWGVETGGTVVAPMLQFAYYMGISEIYLLGIDFSYHVSRSTGNKTVLGDQILESQGEMNHFHPGYSSPGELWTFPKLDMQYSFFKRYNDHLRQKEGRQVIFNASRKTKLDVFPRVDLSDILHVKV